MNNELEFFGINQKDALKSMAEKIIANYNSLGGEISPSYEENMKAWFGKETNSLLALLAKCSCLIFDRGDPLSVPVLLKKVATGKIRGLGQPGNINGAFSTLEETFLGFGHFRCYGNVYTLDDIQLKALRLYLKSDNMDYATTEFKFGNLIITARLIKSGVSFPNSKNDGLHNKYDVSVKNTESENTTSFDFYDSTHNYNNVITEIKGSDLLQAFDCFVSDAIAGMESFEDFCSNFGYDEDSRAAERIYKECIKSMNKAQSVIEDDIYEFANKLHEHLN